MSGSDVGLLFDLSFRVAMAILLGAAIGLERQWRLRTAGIRTNALVSVGAALFVILGAFGFGDAAVADPTRVAAQVVSGIGFLGAGVILRDGLNIRGLTTAATLWCAAAIGALAGAGMLWMALIGAAAIVATNILFRPLGRVINRKQRLDPRAIAGDVLELNHYELEVVTTEKSESRVRALVLQAVARPGLTLRSVDTVATKNSRVRVLAHISATMNDVDDVLERALRTISLDPKVLSTSWWEAEATD